MHEVHLVRIVSKESLEIADILSQGKGKHSNGGYWRHNREEDVLRKQSVMPTKVQYNGINGNRCEQRKENVFLHKIFSVMVYHYSREEIYSLSEELVGENMKESVSRLMIEFLHDEDISNGKKADSQRRHFLIPSEPLHYPEEYRNEDIERPFHF